MAPITIRKALGAVKDQTSIGLAKVNSSDSLSDLEVAIVKATRHDENPAEDKYFREIVSLTCYSRAYISSCVNFLSRRLNKTRNWIVALKTLMLTQRLLTEGDPAYEQEIFFATRRGTRMLNMADFRSTSGSWDSSAFVRTYSLYLDQRLELRMQSRREKRPTTTYGVEEDEDGEHNYLPNSKTSSPVQELRIEQLFTRIQNLQQLLERFLACRPTGVARTSRVVIVALYPIVKESFQIYYDITEMMSILIDRFMELEIRDCVKVYEIFCRISKQFDELESFYDWSRSIGVARNSEYPEVEKIPQKKLDVMDKFIHEKSAMMRERRVKVEENTQVEYEEMEPEEEEEVVEDMNAIRALPAPEGFTEEKEEEKIEVEVVEEISAPPPQPAPKQVEGDLLNLGEDAGTTEYHSNKLALALFDGGLSTTTTSNSNSDSPWEAFKSDNNWETTLVQSASHLSNQKTSLAGGFDSLLLDGMYRHGVYQQQVASMGVGGPTGSASSVALGSAGKPAMLALPAPPQSSNTAASTRVVDPFAASLAVAPPPYVQMSEMEKKQKLLVEEQLMWQQYANNGMQGNLGFANFQANQYNVGGYSQRY